MLFLYNKSIRPGIVNKPGSCLYPSENKYPIPDPPDITLSHHPVFFTYNIFEPAKSKGMENNVLQSTKLTEQATFITTDALLEHWQGHRRVTRRVIEAFPDDRLLLTVLEECGRSRN
jgi:hypothetical protein